MSDETTTTEPAEEPTEPGQAQPETPADEPLGEKGLRALEAEKEKRKASEAKRRAAEAELAELKKAGADPETRARLEAQEAKLQAKNERIVRTEIKAAAAGKLADPLDALEFIKPGQFDVGENDEVDEQAIAEAIDDLLARKPYLAAKSTTPPPINQGVRKVPATPTLAEQIAAAEKAGDWKTSLRLKNQQLYEQSK